MGQLKVKVKHAPSLTKCWARWARSCVDLVWIVLSCQATQAERPDSLTQSKPNLHMVLLHSAQHFWVTEAWITLTFNCPIQIPIFFQKTSTVRCPVPAYLIKSVHIEKNSQTTKTSYGSSRGLTNKSILLCSYQILFHISARYSNPALTGLNPEGRVEKYWILENREPIFFLLSDKNFVSLILFIWKTT